MSDNVLCKDCKHSFRSIRDILIHGFFNGYAYRCKKAYKEKEIKVDLVVGSKIDPAHYENCTMVRLHAADYKDNCGKEGRWWEPKNNKKFFLYLKRI